MIILDTDCLSLFDREKSLESSILRNNLAEFAPEDIFTTIITFEEQMRGWLTYLAKCKNIEEQIFAYQRLNQFLNNFRKIAVVQFDQKAAAAFREFKSQKIRVGTMDLKIAAIAVSQSAILVSRNLSDFLQIPNLTVQDWTK
ncbi:MAG: type II toxin-antitoxin system VapC family toxin [Acidobacteriota bacterium]|nr:type II toxin-antitoxin system VapC family toxin [Acidobacteriota bacterium]